MGRPRLPDPEPSKGFGGVRQNPKPITAAQIKATAKRAVQRRAPGQSKKVTLTLRITITRERAEQLSEAAIREERSLEDLVEEIVEGDSA